MFKGKLRSVKKNTVFAESTYNDTWGTELDKQGTESLARKNLLGQIIGKISKKIGKARKAISGASPNKNSIPKSI